MVTKRNVPVDLCRAPRGYSSRTSLSPCPKQQLSAVDSATASCVTSKGIWLFSLKQQLSAVDSATASCVTSKAIWLFSPKQQLSAVDSATASCVTSKGIWLFSREAAQEDQAEQVLKICVFHTREEDEGASDADVSIVVEGTELI
ncbi:hypothetical protein N1851_008266 [Merluccius polli]|uniref:Uncharacterized protein n=1 Tax=Merluccius polli TaxID=89951 RepID=A0AA47N1R6_MERPO|nr:hypothetical protein N1851_008266 [Merluccius polli]